MFKRTAALAVGFTIVGAVFISGCASTPARRIDSRGPETITTIGDLDIQDAMDAAGALSQSLLSSGVLGRYGQPSIIAIDRYINNTTQHIDGDRILKKIRVTLNKAGVAQTIMTIDSRGNRGGESNIASAEAAQQDEDAAIDVFLNGSDDAPRAPAADYALTFKLGEVKARAGRTRQKTYTFGMTLTDVQSGLAVWEEETMITKQGTKPAAGW